MRAGCSISNRLFYWAVMIENNSQVFRLILRLDLHVLEIYLFGIIIMGFILIVKMDHSVRTQLYVPGKCMLTVQSCDDGCLVAERAGIELCQKSVTRTLNMARLDWLCSNPGIPGCNPLAVTIYVILSTTLTIRQHEHVILFSLFVFVQSLFLYNIIINKNKK